MKKRILHLALQLSFGFTTINAQIATVPNYPDIPLSAASFSSLHTTLEQYRAMLITQTLNSNTCVYTQSGNWPNGTWYRGYQDYYATKNIWCNSQAVSGQYYSNHPLIRQTSENGRAYMHLSRQFNDAAYIQRTKWAAEYLSNAQTNDGNFIWWYLRPGLQTMDVSDATGQPLNFTNGGAYETAHGLITLVENYWYLRSINDPAANALYDDIEHAATKFLTEDVTTSPFYGGGSYNYKAFAMWGLAGAYKVTANRKYLQKAIDLFNLIKSRQDTSSQSPHFGTWTGITYNVQYDAGGSTGITVQKEALIWYHFIILRGLVETLTAFNELSPLSLGAGSPQITNIKNELYTAIERGINHVINYRFDSISNQMRIYPYYNGSYCNSIGTAYAMPAGVTEYVVPDAGITTIGMLAYHALGDSHYSPAEKNSLINLLNRAIAGEDPGSPPTTAWYLTNRPSWYFTNYATYTDYISTIRNWQQPGPRTPANQLKRVVKVDDDLLYASSGSNDYYDNPYSTGNQSIPTSALGAVDKWIKGDFNGDGADEICYKPIASNNVYFSTDINFASPNVTQIYSGNNGALTNWIKGDFDGDGIDELLYQLGSGNINKLVSPNFNFNNSTTITLPVQGSIDKWIVGDFNGDGRDELLYKLANNNYIYKYVVNSSNVSAITPIYTGSLTLDKWIAGDFNASGGDGKDELVYKFAAATIYKNTGLTNLDPLYSTTVYSGTFQLDKWVVGDFDGDLDQELLQTFTGINKIYYSEDASALGIGQIFPATGAYSSSLKNWIVGDFDGDRDDDLIYWFNLSFINPTLSVKIVDDVKNFQTPVQYSTVEPTLWLVGNFNASPTIAFRQDNGTELGVTNESLNSEAGDFEVFPNPFNKELNISLNLAEAEHVSIMVYDISGRLIQTIADDYLNKDFYTFKYNPDSDQQPGMYFVSIRSKQINVVKKVVLMD